MKTSMICNNSDFPVEVMCQYGREEIDLIADLSTSRDIVHLSVQLELSKDTFLGTASVVEGRCPFGRGPFVGDE